MILTKILNYERKRQLKKAITKLKIVGKNIKLDPTTILAFPEQISIQDDTNIQRGCFLDGKGGIDIGEGVILANNVQILSADHNYDDEDILAIPFDNRYHYKKVIIEDYVWIGSNVTILPGVRISKGAVVGAGSVVTKDVAPYMVVAGNPAKIIKSRDNIEKFDELMRKKRSLFVYREEL